jgi:PAS domain S-box-containing protein
MERNPQLDAPTGEQFDGLLERLEAFTRHSPAAMFFKDREGRYRFVNDQFLARFSLRREQVMGRSDAEIFPGPHAALSAAHDAQVLARGVPLTFEESLRRFGGERVSVVVRFPVYDAAGRAAGVGGIATDITERKLAERSLREQQALLAGAQKLAGVGCWEWDPEQGRMTWSEELYRIHGVDPSAWQPGFESYLDRVHNEDRAGVGAILAQALADGAPFSFEERIVRPDGEVRHLRTRGEALRDERGRPAKIFGVCLDITEQKMSFGMLRAVSRRLVEAEEAERRRIARELHDRVGQNLSALTISLNLVAQQAKELPPALSRRLEDAQALVDATLQSIENLMTDLRPPLLDEYGLGAALGAYAEEFAQRTGVRVEVEGSQETARSLRPEAAIALYRIAQEALNNVAKHADARSVEILLEKQPPHLVLIICDDGHGFDAGLAGRGRWGMSAMRERAEAAGGKLTVVSAPGEGAIVRVAVPLPESASL